LRTSASYYDNLPPPAGGRSKTDRKLIARPFQGGKNDNRAHPRRQGWRRRHDAGYIPAPSTLSQTAWALLGLMAAGLVEDKAVTLGVPYLTRTQAEDGFWKEERFTATGFPRLFFLRYHGYAKYFPLWAMARFRNLKKGDRHPVLVGM
jgi:Squalene-hopene cyclase C-terminal domain